jgi:catechol-2,3-dioxygenase
MRLGAVVLDSGNSDELAGFYQKLLGWSKEVQTFEGDKWVIVKSVGGESLPLVFQQVDNYEKPKWPSASGIQQQMMHLDFYVKFDEYSKNVEHAISCGATVSEVQYSEGLNVMLDPAGHPFCIIPIPPEYEI